MILILTITIALIFLFIMTAFFNSFTKIKLSGRDVHPLSICLILNIFIYSFPGVLLISFFHIESNRYSGISDAVKYEVGFWYIYSLLIIIGSLFVYGKYLSSNVFNRNIKQESKINLKAVVISCIFVCTCFMIFRIVFLPQNALMQLISTGDVFQAYTTRVDMQKNPMMYNVQYVGQLLRYFSFYQFILCSYIFFVHRGVISKLIFIVSFLLCAAELLGDLQKAPLMTMIIICLYFYYMVNGLNKKLISWFVLFVMFILFVFAFFAPGEMDIASSIEGVLSRVFLGQNQGLYHILNTIKPDEKYWWEGFYFINKLGVVPSRADIDIVPYIYDNSDSIVNTNTWFLAQAWSMYGYLGLIMSPFIVSIFIVIVLKFFDVFIEFSPVFFIPALIFSIVDLRLNNNFSSFLFGKEFVLRFIILFICIVPLYVISNTKFRRT